MPIKGCWSDKSRASDDLRGSRQTSRKREDRSTCSRFRSDHLLALLSKRILAFRDHLEMKQQIWLCYCKIESCHQRYIEVYPWDQPLAIDQEQTWRSSINIQLQVMWMRSHSFMPCINVLQLSAVDPQIKGNQQPLTNSLILLSSQKDQSLDKSSFLWFLKLHREQHPQQTLTTSKRVEPILSPILKTTRSLSKRLLLDKD